MTAPLERTRARPGALRLRIMLTVVVVAVLPLIVVVAILGLWSRSTVERQSLRRQQAIAEAVQTYIGSLITSVEQEMSMLDKVVALGSLPAEEQRVVLANLMANDASYQSLAVLDASGRPQVRLARDRVIIAGEEVSKEAGRALEAVLGTGATYFGPVEFNEAIREPLMAVAIPLLNRRTGAIDSVLVADMRFQPIRDRLAALAPSEESDVYVVTSAGAVIAHRDPGIVLSHAEIEVPGADGRYPGLSGEDAIVATTDLELGSQHLIVVAERSAQAALGVVSQTSSVILLVALVALVLSLGLSVLAARRIVRPVEALAGSARRIAAGELTHRAAVATKDEIGDLARAFNGMTMRLSELIAGLESRVRTRTHELEDASANQLELIRELEARNTELMNVKQRLEELMSSKDQFLGSVSHELRTPLTAVVGLAEELRDRAGDFEPAERQLLIETVAKQAQEMAQIINDLLVAARDDVSAIVVLPTPIDIGAEIQAVLEVWSEASVVVRRPEQPAMVLADSVRVRQIIRNLIGNTIRYGGPNVEVRIAVGETDVSVEVRDDGQGIPESDWDLVFDPYHTAHRREGQPASVGLGLTVSRMLARRMEGDLTYRYEDGQSVFELRLPRPARTVVPPVRVLP